MKKTIKQICLVLSVISFLVFIGVWIGAIWFNFEDDSFALKVSATSIVVGFASVCGYIFIHEQSDDDTLRDKNLSN